MEATTSTADATRFTPDALLAWLRRQRAAGSIHHDEQQRIWQVFGYADTERVLSDPSAFSSNFSEIIPHQRDFDLLAQGNFVRMDPPKHRKLRALVSQAFTPRMVTARAKNRGAPRRGRGAARDGDRPMRPPELARAREDRVQLPPEAARSALRAAAGRTVAAAPPLLSTYARGGTAHLRIGPTGADFVPSSP